jgi:hypothetical protein
MKTGVIAAQGSARAARDMKEVHAKNAKNAKTSWMTPDALAR